MSPQSENLQSQVFKLLKPSLGLEMLLQRSCTTLWWPSLVSAVLKLAHLVCAPAVPRKVWSDPWLLFYLRVNLLLQAGP